MWQRLSTLNPQSSRGTGHSVHKTVSASCKRRNLRRVALISLFAAICLASLAVVGRAADLAAEGQAVKAIVAAEGKLRRNSAGHVVSVFANSKRITDAQMPYVAQFAQLEELGLPGSSITDEGLKYLVALPKLTSLSLGNTLVTDRGMATIGKIKTLKYLAVREPNVTTAGLKELVQLPDIERFVAPHRLDDEGVAIIVKWRKLRHLTLDGPVSKRALDSIATLPKLVDLQIWSGVGDRDLESLRASKSLQTLGTLCNISTTGMRYLGETTSLRELDLDFLPITDDGVRQLTGMSNLRKLLLRGTKITDKCGAFLAALKGLESLDLSETRIADDGVRQLKPLAVLAYFGAEFRERDGCRNRVPRRNAGARIAAPEPHAGGRRHRGEDRPAPETRMVGAFKHADIGRRPRVARQGAIAETPIPRQHKRNRPRRSQAHEAKEPGNPRREYDQGHVQGTTQVPEQDDGER